MPLHPCTDACRYAEMEAVIERLLSALQRLTTAVGDLAVEKADDELHRAYAEAKALLTPNAIAQGREHSERPAGAEG